MNLLEAIRAAGEGGKIRRPVGTPGWTEGGCYFVEHGDTVTRFAFADLDAEDWIVDGKIHTPTIDRLYQDSQLGSIPELLREIRDRLPEKPKTGEILGVCGKCMIAHEKNHNGQLVWKLP